MAITTGFVQRLKVFSGVVFVSVGPTPTNAALHFIEFPDGLTPVQVAGRSSMVDALSSAMMTRREVSVTYPDAGGGVDSVVIDPV